MDVDKHVRLAPRYQAALIPLYFAVFMGTMLGLASGTLGGAGLGILIGVVLGLGNYYRMLRRNSEHDAVVDDYPEELQSVERRYDKLWIALSPSLMLCGIAISWILVGTGWYGLLGALPAIAVASWVLGRFGGPSDPKWKKARDEWIREHGNR